MPPACAGPVGQQDCMCLGRPGQSGRSQAQTPLLPCTAPTDPLPHGYLRGCPAGSTYNASARRVPGPGAWRIGPDGQRMVASPRARWTRQRCDLERARFIGLECG
jgi:hypothetical protein